VSSIDGVKKKKGKFGISRDETIENRSLERRNSKGSVSPNKYYADYIGQRVKLSHRRLPQQYSMPKGDRGLSKS